MSNIIPFNYQEKQVRTILKDGEPWFVAADVCDILGLINPTESIKALDEDEKSTLRISEGGPERNIISEAGLYSLIIRSNKPEAKEFKRWITHEVIPSIRKTGQYTAKPVTALEALAQTVQVLQWQEQRLKLLEGTTQAIKDAVISEPDNWREDINHKLNKISQSIGENKFRDVRVESYKLLEQRAGVLLDRRLDNLKTRLLKQGIAKSKIDKANRMDVIDEDKKLREIYGKIVSEYIIRYTA
jgi:prophage antirepressor-like protein